MTSRFLGELEAAQRRRTAPHLETFDLLIITLLSCTYAETNKAGIKAIRPTTSAVARPPSDSSRLLLATATEDICVSSAYI